MEQKNEVNEKKPEHNKTKKRRIKRRKHESPPKRTSAFVCCAKKKKPPSKRHRKARKKGPEGQTDAPKARAPPVDEQLGDIVLVGSKEGPPGSGSKKLINGPQDVDRDKDFIQSREPSVDNKGKEGEIDKEGGANNKQTDGKEKDANNNEAENKENKGTNEKDANIKNNNNNANEKEAKEDDKKNQDEKKSKKLESTNEDSTDNSKPKLPKKKKSVIASEKLKVKKTESKQNKIVQYEKSSEVENEKKESEQEKQKKSLKENSTDREISKKESEDKMSSANSELKKEKWHKFASSIAEKGAEIAEKEFETLCGYMPPFVSKLNFVANMDKNRFSDMVCLDHSRVTLDDGAYIHASWVDIDDKRKAILTQLPLQSTSCEFWQMIIEKKVKAIIVLLTDQEYHEFGGDFVFPRKHDFIHFAHRSIRVGDFSELEVCKSWTMKVMSVSNGSYKSFVHVHRINDWQHNEAPKNNKVIWQLQSTLRKYSGPIVVLSLSGCGRAGTYALFELSHHQLHNMEPQVSIEKCLKRVRSYRLHAVQNITQYSFIYAILGQHVLENGFNKIIKPVSGDDIADEGKIEQYLRKMVIS